MINIIFDILNSFFLIAISIAYFDINRRQNKRIRELAETIGLIEKSLTERLITLEKDAAERNAVHDSSKCYQAAKIELLFKKENKNPEDLLAAIQEMMKGNKLNLSVTTIDYSSPTFGDDIKDLDSKHLKKLLQKMKELEEFRLANIVQRELNKREGD